MNKDAWYKEFAPNNKPLFNLDLFSSGKVRIWKYFRETLTFSPNDFSLSFDVEKFMC